MKKKPNFQNRSLNSKGKNKKFTIKQFKAETVTPSIYEKRPCHFYLTEKLFFANADPRILYNKLSQIISKFYHCIKNSLALFFYLFKNQSN